MPILGWDEYDHLSYKEINNSDSSIFYSRINKTYNKKSLQEYRREVH